MTKQEYETLGYIYTNLTSGYTGVNYDMFVGATGDAVESFLSAIKPEITKNNFIDIIIGLDKHGVLTGKTEKNIAKIGKAELPDIFGTDFDGSSFRMEKSVEDYGVYETVYVAYRYVFGSKMQIKSKSAEAREQRLISEISALADRKNFDQSAIQRIAEGFMKISTIDDIEIRLYRTFPLKDTGELCIFNKQGLRVKESLKSGSVISRKEYIGNIMTETFFEKERPVKKQVSVTDVYGLRENTEEILTYNAENRLEKSKTTISMKLSEGFAPVCFVHKHYGADEKLESLVINDKEYGKKTYKLEKNGFILTADDQTLNFDGDIDHLVTEDPIETINALMFLEGGLRQLEKRVPELPFDHKKLLDTIYVRKANNAMAAIKEEKVILYIADKGNTTIYDTNHKRIVYFPVDIIKKYLPSYKNYPNVLVEQRIKDGNDSEAIQKLYDFGTKTSKDTIYAFHRVVKALVKNPATPAGVLDDIVDKISDGTFEYDTYALAAIASNPSTQTSTLQKLIDRKPSAFVRSCIEANPNRPEVIKAAVTKKDAEKAANAIFGAT